MNTSRIGLTGLLLALSLTMAHAGPPTVNPEQMDLDVDILAKIAKEKSKGTIQGAMKSTSTEGDGKSSSSSDCGSVNINSSNNQKSNSGLKEMFGKQSTTIVTGPVINMANCK